jgi:hypothetical protein
MSSVNSTNFTIDKTVRVFDLFYKFDINVPAVDYDIIYSYFLSKFTTAEAAGNMTVVLFRVANETGTPVMTLFQELQGKNAPELNLILCYYINGLRSPLTLLGINIPTRPNQYAIRNCLA